MESKKLAVVCSFLLCQNWWKCWNFVAHMQTVACFVYSIFTFGTTIPNSVINIIHCACIFVHVYLVAATRHDANNNNSKWWMVAAIDRPCWTFETTCDWIYSRSSSLDPFSSLFLSYRSSSSLSHEIQVFISWRALRATFCKCWKWIRHALFQNWMENHFSKRSDTANI